MAEDQGVLDDTAQDLLDMFSRTVRDWKRSDCIIDFLDGQPLPPVTDPRYYEPVDELSRALALHLIDWAVESVLEAQVGVNAQIAAIREAYELGLTLMTHTDQRHVDLLLIIRLQLGSASWKERLREEVVRDACDGIDIGVVLTELEDLDLIRRTEGSIVIGCW